MVILFEWHHIAMDQKSRNGLPMTGEDTGLEALASPLAGYLGKIRERAASLENCPWCTSKGLTYVLRSYRLNLQESITLCTNPECLFPLVSQSLEDVLASLVLVEPVVGSKRKNALEMEKEELIKPECKRLRSSDLDSLGTQSITDSLISQTEHGVSNGQHAAPKTDGEKVNGNNWDSPVAETTGRDSPEDEDEDEDDVLEKASVNAGCTDGVSPTSSVSAGQLQCSSITLTADGNEPVLSPHCGALGILEENDDIWQVKSPPEALNTHCSLDSSQSFFKNEKIFSTEIGAPAPQHNETTMGHKSLTADITSCKNIEGIESEGFSSTTVIESSELLPIPNQLFWRNSNNLCWLDSMLVALVKCKSLRKCQPKETQWSPVWQLIKGYEDVCAAIQIHQQPVRDGVVRVPNHVLQKADADLQRLRMSVFKLLQPKLHCKLGQTETPVFALPLLLAMDSWVEPLFKLIFYWEMKCSQCKTPTKERVRKTLPSFTNILPDWCPLNAVHLAPCNVCSKKNQRRTMMLHRVPPVFGLHFVEGLLDNDVRNYTFTFKGKRYSVTTFIQYNQQLKHFVTWICNSDGSWMEYDDLKHPVCKTYQKLPVPAEEIHIVFWEVEDDKEPQACSPSSTFAESQSQNEMNLSPGDEDLIVDELLAHTPDHSLLMLHNDTDIICALSTSEDGGNLMDTTVTADIDTSIGSTTLLDTFEGLTHNDIITLTLVEIKDGSDLQTVNDNAQTQDFSVSNRNEIMDSTPDSSSAVKGSEMSDAPVVELPTTSNSSESDDDSSSDPTFVPHAKAGRGRSKPNNRKIDKTAASFKVSPHISSSESSEPSEINDNKPASAAVAQDSTPPAETTQQVSPVSSTNTSPLATTQSSTMLPMPLQNSRWSFLLSKHPVHQVGKTVDKFAPTPVTQVRTTRSIHNPLKRQQIPGGLLPKPKLRTEESEGLPPKAAEMYDSFGVKSLSTSSPLPPPPDLNLNIKSKLSQPIASNHQKLLMNTRVVSGTSLLLPGAKGLPDISSSRNRSNQFSKVAPGLNETEALRYKLLKKLKAKKKKLAQLNEMLGHQGGVSLRPDSTDLCSPNTVTSSTYDRSIGDDLLSDLLSPATTASNLSPDSTGFLEMLANGHEAVDQLDSGVGAVSQVNPCVNKPDNENFLDDFLSQAVAQRPTEMETEALSALELFI